MIHESFLPQMIPNIRYPTQLYCSTVYKILLAIHGILTLYAKKNFTKTSLKLGHYCTLLSMASRFEHVIITFSVTFVIKQAVKLNGFASKQYVRTAPFINMVCIAVIIISTYNYYSPLKKYFPIFRYFTCNNTLKSLQLCRV